MKKYLLGIFAIVLALSLSSFGKKQTQQIDGVQPYLYWYFIETNGSIGPPVIDENLRTKADVFETVDCDDEPGGDCARGYESTKTFGNPAPAPTDDDDEDHISDRDL